MMGIPSPDLAGTAIQAGVETLILDMEHGFPGLREVREAVPPSRLLGGRCMVRLARDMLSLVGPLADLDVDGLLLSGPESVAEVENFVSLALLPPRGKRSVNPFVPAAGVPGSVESLRQRSDELQLWAMAETESLLRDLSSRGQVPIPGLDCILIGPYDLAADLGMPASPSDPTLVEAVSEFVKWAESTGTGWALFVRDVAALDAWWDVAIRPESVVLGYDRDVWFNAVRARVEDSRHSAPTST